MRRDKRRQGFAVRWRALGLAFLLPALTMVAPTNAQAFTKAIWGQNERNGVGQFPLYHRLGVGIDEMDLDWAQVAPVRPRKAADPGDSAYRWPAAIAQAVTRARRYHIRILLQVIFTPRWANHDRAPNYPPSNPKDYAAFVTAAARRYPSVHLWMVWGEPTRSPNFALTRTVVPGHRLTRAELAAPHTYARILDAAYGALKAVSHRNLVIGGCTYSTGQIVTESWIQNLRLPDGRPPRMDMYAHNPFSDTAPSFSAVASPFGEVQFSDLHRLAGWVDRYLRRGMPIFLSEFTIPTAPDDEFSFYVDPPVAAQWVTKALRLSRSWKRIYALGWIHVYDDPPTSSGGLLTASGHPKPDFFAFQHG